MILRFLLLTAIFALLNQKALSYTAIVVGHEKSGRVHFYKATDEYGIKFAEQKAHSACMNTASMEECQLFQRLDGSARAPQCLAIVVVYPLGDSIYRALAVTDSAAYENANKQCEHSRARGSWCMLRELLCDPDGGHSFSADNPEPEALAETAAVLGHIQHVEALSVYATAFGFGLFVLLSLYELIAHDRRSVLRMALNLFLSFTITVGIVATGLIAPPTWEWILSLSIPVRVLLITMTCGTMLLFIPRKFWRALKERKAFVPASILEAPENQIPAANSTGVVDWPFNPKDMAVDQASRAQPQPVIVQPSTRRIKEELDVKALREAIKKRRRHFESGLEH